MSAMAFIIPPFHRITRYATVTRACKAASPRKMMCAPSSRAAKPATPPKLKPLLTLLYDGECPLCMKEVTFLRERSAKHNNALEFVDIASNDYDPAKNHGITYDAAMGRIHAIDSEGHVVTGVKVFRDAYQAVGLGWVYALTKLPGFSWLAERLYDIWAQRRLQMTGRPPLIEIIKQRQSTCRK